MRIGPLLIIGALAASLAACSLAPDYHRPKMEIPKNYKESAGSWLPLKQAAMPDKGAWWKVYNDEDLNALEDKVAGANQNLKAALARYDEARAVAAQARAGYFPTVTANASATREHLSKTTVEVAEVKQYNDFLAGVDFSYELDVWGKVRNAVKSSESLAKATAADMAVMDLGLHAELAMDYFALRTDDASQTILDETVVAYEKALALTNERHKGGITPEVDVDQAEAQFEHAKTMAADMHLKRAQLEHAIAVLVGEVPSSFSIEVKNTATVTPPVVPGLPSSLLEARPDIAAAGLRVEAANADIGVARAAFYPDFTFDMTAGYESAVLSQLAKAPSLFWSIGPSVAEPLFDGGKISALLDRAHAAYDESVANYRQTVLTAFQEVEDNLVALRELEQEDKTENVSAEAANRALMQAKNRYEGGIATYLDVVVAQNTALQTQLSALDINTRRLEASVMLIKSLGGNWQH